SETTLPPDAPASARGTLDSMQGMLGQASPLPAEPVGVGARWETEAVLHQNGLEMHQVSRFTLRERAGSRVKLDVEIEQSAPAQEMKIPSGKGATAHLESLRGTGGGTLELDLGRVVPRRGRLDLDLDSQMEMKVPAGGQSMSISMGMKMLMELH